MKIKLLNSCMTLILFVLSGCSDDTSYVVDEQVDSSVNLPSSDKIDHTPRFTFQEQAYIEKLKKRRLRVAADNSVVTYKVGDDGKISGMHYELIAGFAEFIGTEIDLRVVPFKTFFTKDGELPPNLRTDPEVKYTPDIFNEVDVCISGITDIGWRRKLVQFVIIYPSSVVVVSRRGEEIRKLSELEGLRIGTRESSTYYDAFLSVEKKFGFKLDYTFYESSAAMFEAVDRGDVDATCRDADGVVLDMKNVPNLNISIPITDVEHLGWIVRKDNKLLASILSKYIAYCKKTETFNKAWFRAYGMNFNDFLRIIQYN